MSILSKSIPVFLVLFLTSCNEIYKAGNATPLLSIQIETNINQNFAFEALDSSATLSKYKSPEHLNELLVTGGDLEYFPSYNKIIYFSTSPIEAYHLNSNGVFVIQQIYNPTINPDTWISERSKLNTSDFERIESRINTFLKDVYEVGKSQKKADSIVFWRKPYDSIYCKIKNY